MTDKQFKQFNKNVQESIKGTIETTVNGKIKRLDEKLDTYIKDDNEWKAGVTPSIEVMKKIQGSASVGVWILKTIILVGAAATAVWAFIKFIINN